MKKITNALFSADFTLILLLIFAAASGGATFIEDKYDTYTAHINVYDAKWFEILMLLLVMNFIGNIQKYNLLSKKRFAIFIFHFAFIILILGAGITRYTGFEGNMHIREGKESNFIKTAETVMQAIVVDNNNTYSKELPLNINDNNAKSFQFNLDVKDKGQLEIKFLNYVKNAIEVVNENTNSGKDIIELKALVGSKIVTKLIKDGEIKDIGGINLSFNNTQKSDAIKVKEIDGKLTISSAYDIISTTMQETEPEAILKDSIKEFKENRIYKANGLMFAFTHLYKNAQSQWVSGKPNDQSQNILFTEVSFNGKKTEVPVIYTPDDSTSFQEVKFDGILLKLSYGEKTIHLPFTIHLNDFILDRYAGSMSPSSFASEVTLIDNKENIKENHRIFMNNVLDYKGYRFFQSSYDIDEKGTILSVNHDFWGTWITYLGYFLLGVGFFLTLLNRSSRFAILRTNIKKIRALRKSTIITLVFILFGSIYSYSQNIQKPINNECADKFGHLLVQTFDGRFEPVHTLAYDVMHKLTRKDQFNIEGKGNLNAMQVFLDLLMDAEFWKNQKIIYVREKSVLEAIGINDSKASFNDFYDGQKYKLEEFVDKAYRKKPSEQNKFDKEIIKVDERINVYLMVLNGNMLKLFPEQNSPTNKWVNWNDSAAHRPLTGSLNILNSDLQLRDFNYSNILELYFQEVFKAANQTNDFSRANQILGYIDNIQRQVTPSDLIPSKAKVDSEIFYNKAKIFENLRNIYGLLSLILLSLAFTENLRVKKSKIISIILNICIGLLGIAFLYHTYGMGLRWYLTGHAPWSNGYEALLLVAWGGIVAGFYFIRYSKITLAATSVLAFAVLMTAGHSSYDPQLTNLQPVLKSYWLIIHVASITISYGFLGLGFFLGLINVILYLFKNKKNFVNIDLLIKELTFINEMNLEIGLFLATLGTFLGGVWANESWGRYWGWDAKETWALVIVVVYAIVLHMRLIPKLKGVFAFNVASIIGFSSVIMTFVGVNYYLSKGLHSYGTGDTPVFPLWAWLTIFAIIFLIIFAGIKDYNFNKKIENKPKESNV